MEYFETKKQSSITNPSYFWISHLDPPIWSRLKRFTALGEKKPRRGTPRGVPNVALMASPGGFGPWTEMSYIGVQGFMIDFRGL